MQEKSGRFVCWLLVWLAWAATDVEVAADQNTEYVLAECGHTRYPQLCVETLSGFEPKKNSKHVDVLSALVNKTISEIHLPVSNYAALSYHFISLEAQHARIATGYCHELMEMSVKRLNQALSALRDSPIKRKQDIQTWLSAALTYKQLCKDSVEDHAASDQYMAQISKKMDYLSQLCSNSLALVNRITKPTKNDMTSSSIDNHKKSKGRNLSEERMFPRWVSAKDRKLLQSNTIKADAVVANDGSGDYQTIHEAINAASGGRFVIYVKSGVYKEKIRTDKDGIALVGDGKYSTIILGDDSVSGGTSLKGSSTFSIFGDDFIAMNIGFQNAAGAGANQAIALTVASDHSVIYKCSITGYQDTLYALSLRQFYRECDISGTVDFIFGNAAAVIQSSNLALRRPRSGGAYNVILANGRSDPGQNTGFSIQNCRITAASDFSSLKHSYSSYLGRPWKQYSRSIVMQSTIDDVIAQRGWVEWPGASGSSLKTLYFAEYANSGSSANTANRVKWPGFHVLSRDEAVKYTVASFISGTSWIPSGVTFDAGL